MMILVRELEEVLACLKELSPDAYRRAIGDDNEIVGARAMGMVRQVLALMIYPGKRSNVTLEAEVIGLAIGFPGLGGMQEVGKRYGLGRAAISKRVLKVVDLLGLPASFYMRDEKARKVYSKTNAKRKHMSHFHVER